MDQGHRYFAATASGRRIEYHVRGRCAADDPVLILLMGMGYLKIARLVFDDDLALALAYEGKWTKDLGKAVPFKVICMMRAGYGSSTINMSASAWCYSDFVEDIAAVADAAVGLGTPFALLANSSGGPNALAAAALLPSRVTALCVFSGDACYEPGKFPKAKEVGESLAADADGKIVIKYVDAFGSMRKGGSCGSCCCAGPCCYCCPYGIKADLAVEVKAWDFAYEDIKCPVWFFAGSRETCVDPNTSRYNASRISQAKLELIDSKSHPVRLKPERFETMLQELREAALQPPRSSVAPLQAEMIN